MGKVLSTYNRYLVSHPYTTNIIGTSSIFAATDYVVQEYLEKKEELDWNRLTSVPVCGVYLAWFLQVQFTKLLPFLSTKVLPKIFPKTMTNPTMF